LHHFAFHARKSIELANLKSHASSLLLAEPNEVLDKAALEELDIPTHTTESLWFILGRIIHSRQIDVAESARVEVGTEWAAAPRLTYYYTPTLFIVQSDYDSKADTEHHVEMRRLISSYVALDDALREAGSLR
jgi:hypothetical protein